jgi:hypothetical protein
MKRGNERKQEQEQRREEEIYRSKIRHLIFMPCIPSMPYTCSSLPAGEV